MVVDVGRRRRLDDEDVLISDGRVNLNRSFKGAELRDLAGGEGDTKSSSNSLCQLGMGIAYLHPYSSVRHSMTMAFPKLQCRFR